MSKKKEIPEANVVEQQNEEVIKEVTEEVKEEEVKEITLEEKEEQEPKKLQEMEEKFKKEEKVKTTKEAKSPQKPQIVEAKNKKVPVIPKFSGKRFIGGKWIIFEKKKEILVSPTVKACLLNSNAIYL